jgi:uncharacterized protein YyaL (SSP411 family)
VSTSSDSPTDSAQSVAPAETSTGNAQSNPPSVSETTATVPVVASETSASHPAAPVAGKKNRLARETSPYLLQHAANPVDWYPWGEEALQKAQQENKLIFLSIGYSSCHWCHVMERESFVDPEIAAFLNEHFICVKVDREERPDVDAVYMAAVQAITRRGGWPLSVFLTPDAKPFFGGTYFPARDGDRPGAIGFLSLAKKVSDLWKTKPDDVRQGATSLADHLRIALSGEQDLTEPPVEMGEALIERTFQGLRSDFDAVYGGFGYDDSDPDQAKFPQASNLFLLVRLATAPPDDRSQLAKDMLVKTLDHLTMGGIRDHLGGGFHRYSVDRYWAIPHFEKMLYDNGQLASVFAEAYALTGHAEYKRVIDEMVQFLDREMSDAAGGFIAALDADSEHEEGKFYRWTTEQWREFLGADGAAEFAEVYASSGKPNFEGEFFVPQLAKPLREIAAERSTAEDLFQARLSVWRENLLSNRAQRVRPGSDTKVLASWNGMMIRGLADAGRLLENPAYLDRATRAADFILESMRDNQGRLFRTYTSGQAKLNAYVDDYACVIDGLLALHRATHDTRWLDSANALMEKQLELFWDERAGGFFFTSSDHEELLVRGKQFADDAVPAGNSVSVENLVYLGQVLERPEYLERARQTVLAARSLLGNVPHAAPRLVMASMALLPSETAASDAAQ